MKTSNKPEEYFQYIIFSTWIVITVLAAIYFIGAKLVMFDPMGKLEGMKSDEIIKALASSGILKNENLLNTVIHFTTPKCRCEANSQEHKSLINIQAKKGGFSVVNIPISTSIEHIIPSTPSAIIIGSSGELVYLGPYSEGIDCSSSNSLIKVVLDNYNKGYNAELILAQTKGCYCNV